VIHLSATASDHILIMLQWRWKEGQQRHKGCFKYEVMWETVTPDFPKKTKCKPICMPRSSFMHIVTNKCIKKQYHIRKRKIIRDLRLILEMTAPNITGNGLGLRTPSTNQYLHKTSE
jgi:hypothetical protein